MTPTDIRLSPAETNPPLPTPRLRPVTAPDQDGYYYAVRQGWTVEHVPGPQRGRRMHRFDDLASCAQWLNRHAPDRNRTEILVEQNRLVAALAPSDCHGDLVACSLQFDARYKAWLDAFSSNQLSQKAFHALLRANSIDVAAPVLDMLLAAVRDLTITKGGKRQIKLTDHNMIEFVGSTQNREYTGKLPTRFLVNCPIYEGVQVPTGISFTPALPPPVALPGQDVPISGPSPWVDASYAIEVLLSMDEVPSGDVAFVLEAPALPRIVRAARRDAARYFDHLLEDGFLVGLGAIELQDVPACTTPLVGLGHSALQREAESGR